jgi:hypothetical protein
MRIFVLTATYELRVSRKIHLRDHPTVGLKNVAVNKKIPGPPPSPPIPHLKCTYLYFWCTSPFVPVHTCTVFNLVADIATVPLQVQIHQASSDQSSGRPSARCWGWGRGVRYTVTKSEPNEASLWKITL